MTVLFSSLISWGWMRIDTSATNWPIVPARDGTRWVWKNLWNQNWQGKPKYSENCSSANLPTINPTWHHLGSNPYSRGYSTRVENLKAAHREQIGTWISVTNFGPENGRNFIFILSFFNAFLSAPLPIFFLTFSLSICHFPRLYFTIFSLVVCH
jgi:hypothetical protein